MAFALPALPAIFSASAASATAASTAAAATAATSATVAGTTAAAATGFDVLGTAGLAAGGAAGAASTAVPAWLGYTSLGLTALGGISGAVGAVSSANASAGAAKYNAEVAGINAEQARRNEQISAESGEAQVAMQQRKTRAEVGQIKANQAASGIEVNSGSALDVRSSASELGELDALSVRTNAVREAYSYGTQATSFGNEKTLDQFESKNDVSAGGVNAASTLLGAAGTGASNFARYQLSGGFTG